MRIALNYLKLKEDSNRLEVLHWGHFAFVLLGMSFELFGGLDFSSWFISTIFLIIFYRLFFITKKELFYSFWTFSALLALFFFNKIFLTPLMSSEVRLLYIVGSALLGIEIYILSSPIYYPRVSWWEYDFRFRADLKVYAQSNGNQTEARINDLRRNAGCVASFEEFKVGEEIKIESSDYFEGHLTLEVVSKRIYSLGRPYNYGVRFNFDSEDKRESYNRLINIWKNKNIESRQRKFTKNEKL